MVNANYRLLYEILHPQGKIRDLLFLHKKAHKKSRKNGNIFMPNSMPSFMSQFYAPIYIIFHARNADTNFVHPQGKIREKIFLSHKKISAENALF